ncbi:hypothetical protein DYB34_001494 [Aphanomyces astaci]|uniref:Uncharacterized protein n=1 Tax=Aphanomyces astaci TaxID=112090 RepID=A0A3R6W2K2_APHAT|nr:hypothetical protein DYB34_001494 [Aphanomyces astaci]
MRGLTSSTRFSSTAMEVRVDSISNLSVCLSTVLWRGDAAIVGAKEAIALLRARGKKVIFVVRMLIRLSSGQGIPAVVDDIVTSASACAAYLKKTNVQGKVYVVGEAGLATEVSAQGFENFGLQDNGKTSLPHPFQVDPSVGAVVIGLDRDPTYPTDGAILPGGGACVAALQTAVGREPDAIIGKPNQALLQTILSTHSLDPSRTCMVGDRLSTDIEFGRRGGLYTLLVMTGCTSYEEKAAIADEFQRPDFFVEDVNVLNLLAATST